MTASATKVAEQVDRTDGVVVGGDAELDVVGVAVGVEGAHHGNAKTLGFVDGDAASRLVSTTKMASGSFFMLRMPLRLVCSLASSFLSRICSFLGRTSMRPSDSMASSSSMR